MNSLINKFLLLISIFLSASSSLANPFKGMKLSSSVEMEFVEIPAGSFFMGSFEDELGRESDEVRHEATIINGFEMQVTEVTQKQWISVMGSHGMSEYYDECEKCPVVYVSWNDVQRFIKKLNKKVMDGYTYRLPTEAEWEYAARGGTQTAYFFSEDKGRLGEYAWFDGNSEGKTHPVKQKKPNPYGLYDIYGNVYEWVQDWYAPYTYSSVMDPQGPSYGSLRVIRGGGWGSYAQRLRSAYRGNLYPSGHSSSIYVGFRLVRTRH